jgi:RND family efflux transporter MFP subunit
MKTMTFRIIGIILAVAIISCSGDKQAKLAKLRKEHDAISEQIKQLETELAGTDTTKAVVNIKKVVAVELKNDVFRHFIEIQGKLDADDNVGVSAKVAGVIESVLVKVGDQVSKGQTLATIDNKVLKENLKDLNSKLDYATDLFNKQKRLWDQKIGSEVQYLSAKNNKESLENSIKSLHEQIDMYRITSPINGAVGDAPLRVGQAVSPGLPVFRVINFGGLRVVADVAEAYSSKINVGDEVFVYFPDLQKDIPAKISAVSKYINPVNRTFQVEVRFSYEKEGFKANMIAVLKINDYRANGAIVVPLNSIQNDQNGSYVYTVQANSAPVAKKVSITQGLIYNGMVEVTSGLKAGDKVVTVGQLDLEDGQAVKL